MMGGERLDISVRNARSTAAPHKRDLERIVVGARAIVKRYFDRRSEDRFRAAGWRENRRVVVGNYPAKTCE